MITALEYFKIKKRMTKECTIGCGACPLWDKNDGLTMMCKKFEMRYPEKAIAIVEQWGKEHPKKTYLSDFLEKYPNAELGGNGIPKYICPSGLGFENIGKREQCHYRCVECWSQELEE